MNARVTPGSAVRPQDLAGGSFQSLVAGWEYNTSQGKGVTATTVAAFPTKSIMCDLPDFKQVTCNTNTLPVSEQMTHSVHFENEPTTRPNSIFNSSLFRSSSNLYAASSAGTSPSGSVGSTSVTSRNAALREQFLTNGNLAVTPTPSTPTTPSRQFADPPGSDVASHHTTAQSPSYLRTPTTPTYGGSGYRFAGVERLAQRSKIYETPVLTINNGGAVKSDNDALNSKREYYFRDSASPTSTLSNGSKDYVSTRDRLESMGFSNRNGEDLKTSTISKDGEQFVGFSYLPNQIHRKTVKKGFEFTLMVVGESGLGKSTLVNSMFLTDIYSNEYPGPSKRATKTVEVETTRVLLKEKSVNLHLTVVDTPGYGFAMNNTDCWQPIVNFIENRYEEYLNAETRVHRTHIQDNRVHCCLYFISPSGHSLKPIDIEFMLHLHDKVNIIPVIAKADTMTPEEIVQFKKNVLNEINQHKIKIYDFPESDEDEDSKLLKSLKSRVPFAVVGSNYVFDLNGERKRSRKYPWGIVEIENLEHCDFQALRNLVIRHYMLDLLETTNNVHYENYRCRKLTGISPEMAKKGKDNKNPLAQMEEEKKEHDQKMKKMEVEMEQVFEQKVKEKLSKLEESKEEYLRRHEEMTKKLEKERQELEEKRAAFEKEKAAFELVSKDMEEIRRVNTLDVNMRELNLDGKIKEKKKKGLF